MGQWYYRRQDEEFGPVSLDTMRQLITTEELGTSDCVSQDDRNTWTAAGEVEGLFLPPPFPVQLPSSSIPKRTNMASQWYYTNQGQQCGPVASDQLKQLAAAGRLQPSDLVWKQGMPQWSAASHISGLFPNAPPAGNGPATTQADPLAFLHSEPSAAQLSARSTPGTAFPGHQQQVVVHVQHPRKSALVAFLLAFFFGPLGMFYSTVGGALIMLVVSVILAIFTVGFSLLLTHPICCIWAAVAASNSR